MSGRAPRRRGIMTPRRFSISAVVERCDGEAGGTTRPTWRAEVTVGDPHRRQFHDATGEGKAAHVALNRACTLALERARR